MTAHGAKQVKPNFHGVQQVVGFCSTAPRNCTAKQTRTFISGIRGVQTLPLCFHCHPY